MPQPLVGAAKRSLRIEHLLGGNQVPGCLLSELAPVGPDEAGDPDGSTIDLVARNHRVPLQVGSRRGWGVAFSTVATTFGRSFSSLIVFPRWDDSCGQDRLVTTVRLGG